MRNNTAFTKYKNYFHSHEACLLYLSFSTFHAYYPLDELAKCLSIKNADKKIPVLIASEAQMIEIILKYSVLHEVVDKEVGTLIHIAAAENNILLAQALVDKHVEMDIVNTKGFSPLKISSKRGNEGVVRILLEGGANPNFIGKRVPGFSPLNNAVQFGNLGCAKLLIFHGANLVHKDMTNTALHSAAYGGHPDVVEYLIKEAGMYVNQKNSAGKTPLFQSITQNHSTVAKILLDLGGDPNIILNDANETLMHIAVGEGRKEIMTMLLEAKASPDVSLKCGITPLMLAVEADHDDYIPLIMAHGITLAKKDEEGNTVLHHIAKHNSCASAKYILRRIGVMKGISQEFQLYKNKNNEDKCAYDVAVECGNEEILKIFVKYAPKGFFDDSKELHRFCDEELYGTLKEAFSRFITIKEGEGKYSMRRNVCLKYIRYWLYSNNQIRKSPTITICCQIRTTILKIKSQGRKNFVVSKKFIHIIA